MRIGFYAPFKPLGHPNPSGDLVIATGLRDYLAAHGHDVDIPSTYRSRWLTARPWRWPLVPYHQGKALAVARRQRLDLWLTYHTYYKSPDVIGPLCARRLGLPYVIFQGIFSTKVRRDPRTLYGYLKNRKALLAADLVFTNKLDDLANLRRIISEDSLRYIPPGIFPADFVRDENARAELRREWNAGETPIVMSAAMFRDDVKTRGLVFAIEALGRIAKEVDFRLVLAGDGPTRHRLEALAAQHLPDRVIFLGKIPRAEMHRYYSAADLFAFPGIRESLGMVYLEAQSCGLPVVAFRGWGVPEVVDDGGTGLLTEPFEHDAFAAAVRELVRNPDRRREMGRRAMARIRDIHDLERNYAQVDEALHELHTRHLAKRALLA